MSKKRRKSTSCFNCATPLVHRENYCPECGQENHNKQASTTILIKDFLGDFWSFDSKLFRSLKPLLFQPGKMTSDYLDGKRQKFIPPIRLFLFLSFIYFGLSLLMSEDWTGTITIDGGTPNEAAQEAFGEAIRNNMNLLFFMFTPVQAVLVMLMFRTEKRRYYVNFFVYTLHLFSLLFIIGMVVETINWLSTGMREKFTSFDRILLGLYILFITYFLIYTVVSLKRVFRKKNNIFLFFVTLLMSLLAFLVVSLLFILLLGWMYNMFSQPVVT